MRAISLSSIARTSRRIETAMNRPRRSKLANCSTGLRLRASFFIGHLAQFRLRRPVAVAVDHSRVGHSRVGGVSVFGDRFAARTNIQRHEQSRVVWKTERIWRRRAVHEETAFVTHF